LADGTLSDSIAEGTIDAQEFFLGPGKTAIHSQELLTAIRIPVLPGGACGRYIKLGRNKAGDLAIAGVAVLGFPAEGAASDTLPVGGSGYLFRIALASVAPVPLRATEAEQVLATLPPCEDTFLMAAERAMAAASPIDDVRAGAAYRRAMVRNLTLRGVREVWQMMIEGN
jgi:CO/xanthine dehydrogenase FAD-binding subunit